MRISVRIAASSAQIATRVANVTAVDIERPSAAGQSAEAVAIDLNGKFDEVLGRGALRRRPGAGSHRAPRAAGRRRAQDGGNPQARRGHLRKHRKHCVPLHAPEPAARALQLRQAGHPRPHPQPALHDLFLPSAAGRTAGSLSRSFEASGHRSGTWSGRALCSAQSTQLRGRSHESCRGCSPSAFWSLLRRQTSSTTSTNGLRECLRARPCREHER